MKHSKCRKCGAKVSIFAKNCSECGSRVLHPIFGIVIAVVLLIALSPLIFQGENLTASQGNGSEMPDYQDVKAIFSDLFQNAEVSASAENDCLAVIIACNDLDGVSVPENWEETISDFTGLLIEGNNFAKKCQLQLLSAEIRANDGSIIASGGNGECTFNKFLSSVPHTSNSTPVSAKDLWVAYEENKINADLLYKDKLLAVNGIIYDIGQDLITKNPCIFLVTTSNSGICLYPIQCYFPDDEELVTKIAGLSDGDSITIFGTCVGVPFVCVQLSDCYF